MPEQRDERPGLHDTVLMSSRVFFVDDRQREGTVVAAEGDHISVEFPNGPGLPPTSVHLVLGSKWRDYLCVVRRAEVDELDRAKAEVARLRERLSEIGAYAAESSIATTAAYACKALTRVARMARAA